MTSSTDDSLGPRTVDAAQLAHLQTWQGRTETLADTITPAPVLGLIAMLDRDDADPVPGTALPPLWHWAYFLPHARQSQLGPDGHPRRGGFLPPVPLPRRMWAGGRLRWQAANPLRVGDAVQRTSRIVSVTHKAGRTGDLLFVLVEHAFSNAQGVALTEEHDIVYRAAPTAPTLGTGVSSLPPEGADSPRGGPSANPNDQKVSFTVPSGNFGNICAGHVARMMGLPIDKLVVATNENDVLDEFFRTGVYRVRGSADTHETSSPSMDISKASNFERFVFDLLGRNGQRTKALFSAALQTYGRFDLSAEPLFADAAGKYGFESGKSTHADRLATIRDTYSRFGVTIDTHTADGVKVAREHRGDGSVPMIVLETALPIKFAETIQEALGHAPERPDRFAGIEALPKRVQVMPADVELVKAYIERHCQ